MRDTMDDGGTKSPDGTEGMTKTVRFASVVDAAGKPEVYLPLSDPKHDRVFLRALRENRVLSIRQEPTSSRTDFAMVGFDESKYTTYLVFPRSLAKFVGARIVGIKYDVVSGSPVVTSASPRATAEPSRAPARQRSRVEKHHLSAATKPRVKVHSPAKAVHKTMAPAKAAAPPLKKFRVHLRVTTTAEKHLAVEATTKTEAGNKARAAVAGEGTVRVLAVTTAD